MPNIGFLSCNANVDLHRILDGIDRSKSRVACLSIQYPDPHWKKAHQKRRVVQPVLVEAISQRIDLDCTVFLQSDVQEVSAKIKATFLGVAPQSPHLYSPGAMTNGGINSLCRFP